MCLLQMSHCFLTFEKILGSSNITFDKLTDISAIVFSFGDTALHLENTKHCFDFEFLRVTNPEGTFIHEIPTRETEQE